MSSGLVFIIFSIEPKEFIKSLEVCFPTYLIPKAARSFIGSEVIDVLIPSNKFLVFLSFH